MTAKTSTMPLPSIRQRGSEKETGHLAMIWIAQQGPFTMEKPALKLVNPESPSFENGTIPKAPKIMPNRKANDRLRGRQHLSEAEVAQLKETALRVSHYGHRDALLIMTAFRHGLRCAELVDLTWDQVDFDAGKLHVRRVKNSSPSTHMLQGDELRAFRRLKREQRPPSPFVFTSERGAPCTTAGFRKMLARLGVAAGIGFPIHPAHAPPRHRFQTRKRRRRHTGDPGLPSGETQSDTSVLSGLKPQKSGTFT